MAKDTKGATKFKTGRVARTRVDFGQQSISPALLQGRLSPVEGTQKQFSTSEVSKKFKNLILSRFSTLHRPGAAASTNH